MFFEKLRMTSNCF